MTDEREQLRLYVESQSEEAFAGIVTRYLPFVYATALRRVGGDVHRAKDVTQLAFIALARNAAPLSKHSNLTGWLFVTTRFLAAKALRTEQRRRTRETEAGMTQWALSEDPNRAVSAALHPLLDDVIAELGEIDQRVILLRFHRGFRLAEIATQLGVTENAVQKRLTRSIEDLKNRLLRRGVTSTAAALTLTLELQSAVTVPAGLAATSTSAATAVATGVMGALKISNVIALSKLQMGIVAAVIVGGALTAAWEYRETTHLRMTSNTQTANAQAAELTRQVEVQSGQANAAEAGLTKLMNATPAFRKEADPLDPLQHRLNHLDALVHLTPEEKPLVLRILQEESADFLMTPEDERAVQLPKINKITIAKIRTILTPEQQESFDAALEKHWEKSKAASFDWGTK